MNWINFIIWTFKNFFLTHEKQKENVLPCVYYVSYVCIIVRGTIQITAIGITSYTWGLHFLRRGGWQGGIYLQVWRRRGIVNYRHFEHFRFFFFNGLRSLSYILLSISSTYVCIIFDQKTIIRITLTYISELGHHFLVLRRLINFPLTMDVQTEVHG